MSGTGLSQQPAPPADKDNIIEGEVTKLLDEFEKLKEDFGNEKAEIESEINKPIVPPPAEAEEAAAAPAAVEPVLLTHGSSITLGAGEETHKITKFNYDKSQDVIEAINYTDPAFKAFSNAAGDLEINFETKLEDGKSVEIDMEQIKKLEEEDKKNKYILEQIDIAFKSGTESASAAAEGGGKKRKNKTKGNRSPIKKKRHTKRK